MMIHHNYDVLDNPAFDRQIELEEEMVTGGIKRFREALERAKQQGQMANTSAGTRLVIAAHTKMVDAIKAFIADAESGKAGRKHTSLKFLKTLDLDTTANITARTILDCAIKATTMTLAAVEIGTALEREVNARKFKEEMPRAYAKFHEKAKKENLGRRQWSHLLFPAALLGVELIEWDQQERLLVGTKLVELFVEATGLIEIILRGDGKGGTIYTIQPTEQTMRWIEEENGRLEAMFPTFMPTIVPPKRWTSPYDGGYYTIRHSYLSLLKTKDKAYLEELASREMPVVYQAVNALQETPWSINHKVLEVMEWVYESAHELADVPSGEAKPLPPKPSWLPQTGKMSRDDMTEEQLVEFKAWKAAAHQVHYANSKAITKRASFLRSLAIARKFKDEEAIYFPHQLDWRGRAYPIPMYLQPQGSDVQRGLLQFADGLPLADKIDADWLAIHGAGTWGYDKVSLDERVQWVEDHEAEILACANDPMGNQWWTEADKPWQFLAFCFDWAGFKAQGYGYVSHLPVQMDGTCNGLQNFSAMLRDEVGGAAVNLIPADKPNDIYEEVAKIVRKMVQADLANEDDEIRLIAKGWAGNITRKTCKRPVMTLPYGAKRFGFVSQVEEDTIKPWREESPETYPFVREGTDGRPFDYGYKAASYMGGLIWEAVGKVVVAARVAMDWLQSVAQIVSKENLPIYWTTPTGLLVQQAYRVPNAKRVETTFNSTRIQIMLKDGNPKKQSKIDSRKQAAGISPNFIHSLDASHLMRTICRANDEGITAFSMIHDSYGTHAANAGALAMFLREEFVRMYAEVDVLQVFKDAIQMQTEEVLPEVPAKGNLDLNLVLESAFFFA